MENIRNETCMSRSSKQKRVIETPISKQRNEQEPVIVDDGINKENEVAEVEVNLMDHKSAVSAVTEQPPRRKS